VNHIRMVQGLCGHEQGYGQTEESIQ
jgi:hypothetical protein